MNKSRDDVKEKIKRGYYGVERSADVMGVAYGKVLIVEDDEDVLELVRDCLEEAGFKTHGIQDGGSVLEWVAVNHPDVIVLDVNLPGMDGISLCRELRRKFNMPVLILSARGNEIDKVVGLEVGADDYLVKPFTPRELVARVRALYRRWTVFQPSGQPGQEVQLIRAGEIVIDCKGHTVEVKGNPVHLTPIEFSLLQVFASHPGQVLSRQRLLDLVWGEDFYGDERTVDVHVRHLRSKLKRFDTKDYLVSVRGVGYKFEPSTG